MKRLPAVAGKFYPSEPSALSKMVENLLPKETSKVAEAKAIICPHAGLIYSGAVAGMMYSSIEPPDTFILLGPNHTGIGAPLAIMGEGQWSVPTGTVDIDKELARKIKDAGDTVSADPDAHAYEHSLEVQLPFIVAVAPSAKIVPISIMTSSLEKLIQLGKDVAEAIKTSPYPITISASTDMSHFVSEDEARTMDKLAIDKILGLDPEGLYHTVRDNGITMCGVLPTVVALSAAIELGATSAEVLKYTTSAEVSGDSSSVVGYVGILIQ